MKRYDAYTREDGLPSMFECDGGDYVRYAEIEHIQAIGEHLEFVADEDAKLINSLNSLLANARAERDMLRGALEAIDFKYGVSASPDEITCENMAQIARKALSKFRGEA